MNITRNTDIKKMQEAAAEALGEALFSARGTPVLLLLSGGSALEILSGIPAAHLGKNLTVGMLDERHDTDVDVNNFLQLEQTEFYRIAKDAGSRLIDSVPKEKESLETFSARIEKEWKRWRKENEDGTIIITEGIGRDGHTAGVMPFPENPGLFEQLFLDDGQWVRGYDAGAKNQYPRRATATLSFLKNEVDLAVVPVAGEEKRPAFRKVISDAGTLAETPARILREMKEVKIFTTLNSK